MKVKAVVVFINANQGEFENDRKEKISFGYINVLDLRRENREAKVVKINLIDKKKLPEKVPTLVAGDLIEIELDYASLNSDPTLIDVAKVVKHTTWFD